MSLADTIVALATPALPAPRAIIRLSGAATCDALCTIGVRPGTAATPGAHHVRVRLSPDDTDAHVFPARLVVFRAPRSFTGEDAAELMPPGNPYLVQRLIDAMLQTPGVRLAHPGEFTARAFLSGKLTAEQAEGVGAIIAARSRAELDAASRLLSGVAGAGYRRLADDLAAALALVEAGIDFTDQDDVVAITPADLLGRLRAVVSGLDATLGPAAIESPAREPVVALVGPPNAGKSTLFNALLGRERVVVSAAPGTTRDAVAERCTLGDAMHSCPLTLVDLAGLDAALAERSSMDALGQRAANDAIAGADVLVLCDPDGLFEHRTALREVIAARPDRPVIRVRTKADLPHTGGPGDFDAMPICALDGRNLAALARAIADTADRSCGRAETLVLPRHRSALAATRRAVGQALAAVEPDKQRPSLGSSETVAAAMREALDHLGELAGRISPDDVIGRIFATFCIGK